VSLIALGDSRILGDERHRQRGIYLLIVCGIAPSYSSSQARVASPPSLQDKIVSACSGNDITKLQSLLDRQDRLILQEAANSETVDAIRYLLDLNSAMEDAEQLALESAAASGNVAVLRYFLKRKPTLDVISQSLRYEAIQGGVKIWRVLLQHNHDLIE